MRKSLRCSIDKELNPIAEEILHTGQSPKMLDSSHVGANLSQATIKQILLKGSKRRAVVSAHQTRQPANLQGRRIGKDQRSAKVKISTMFKKNDHCRYLTLNESTPSGGILPDPKPGSQHENYVKLHSITGGARSLSRRQNYMPKRRAQTACIEGKKIQQLKSLGTQLKSIN